MKVSDIKFKHMNGTAKSIQHDINMQTDPFYFEEFCCNCDHYPGDSVDLYKPGHEPNKCPFKDKFLSGKLKPDTKWREIHCNNFWD